MSIADQVADLERLIASTARKADAVFDENPEQGRQLFESAARAKVELDALKAGGPEGVAMAAQWDPQPPGEPSSSPSEVGSPAAMPVKFSNGLKGSVMMTRCGESPEAVERAKEQLLEAAGYWVPPSEPNPAQPLVAPMRGARSATRPREHRSGRRQATRGSPSDDPDSDSDPPVTRFQRALRCARELDWQETAELVDYLLIRLERWGR